MKSKLPLINFLDNEIDRVGENAFHFINKNQSEYVYLVGNLSTRLFKIGRTNNIHDRVRRLSSQSGCTIVDFLYVELFSDKDIGSVFLEKKLHEFFKDKRFKGSSTEWFSFDIRDIVQIRSLFRELDTFDIYDILPKNKSCSGIFEFINPKTNSDDFMFSSFIKRK